MNVGRRDPATDVTNVRTFHERTRMRQSNQRTTLHGVRLPLKLAGLAGLGLLVAGCATDAPQDTWNPAGDNAELIDDLQRPVFAIAGIIGIIVFVVVAYVLWRYRDRGQPIPEQTHGKPVLEVVLTIIPALILIGVAIPTVGAELSLPEVERRRDQFHIQVEAPPLNLLGRRTPRSRTQRRSGGSPRAGRSWSCRASTAGLRRGRPLHGRTSSRGCMCSRFRPRHERS